MKIRAGVWGTVAVAVAGGLAAARSRWAAGLFSSDYLPHRYCYLAKPWLVWTNVSADSLIGISYAVIFGSLIWMTLRLRAIADLRKYLWVFVSFALFIVACGMTHLMDVVTVWWPFYPMSAAVKVVCALVSVPTAILFAKMTPALAHSMGRFVRTLETTAGQRDTALVALDASQRMAADRDAAAREIRVAFEARNAVLECTSDRVVMLAHDWRVLYANGKAAQTLPDLRLNEDYWRCFPSVIGTTAEKHLRTAMGDRIEVAFEHYYEPTAEWHRARAFPSEEGLAVFYSNITEEKRMQEQLRAEHIMREKRIEALSHMAGGLAHEISNPLAIIHGRASDMRSKAEGDVPVDALAVRELCDGIVKTSDRAIRILRGLRGFGREAVKDPMELVPIAEIVDPCLELQEDRFERHKVGLSVELEEELPLLLCRETQICQILTNLLNNAFDSVVQADAVERWVRLQVTRVQGNICFDVTDSGPGIEEHLKVHLMKPFFTTKEFSLGTGIGLSLSRAIAQDHGGTLILRSGTEHTCFRLSLPIDAAAASAGTENTSEVSH